MTAHDSVPTPFPNLITYYNHPLNPKLRPFKALSRFFLEASGRRARCRPQGADAHAPRHAGHSKLPKAKGDEIKGFCVHSFVFVKLDCMGVEGC